MSHILDGIINRKHYCLIALTYGSGLRLGEVTGLKFGDIDGDRMQLRVRRGKGNKDRYTLLSMDLLEKLREYYRYYRPKTYLFEGRTAGKAYSERGVQDLFKKILEESGIKKDATFHTLRHTFAPPSSRTGHQHQGDPGTFGAQITENHLGLPACDQLRSLEDQKPPG